MHPKCRKNESGTTADPNLDLGCNIGIVTVLNSNVSTRNSSTFLGQNSPPKTKIRSPICLIEAKPRWKIGELFVIRIVSLEISYIHPLESPPTIKISESEISEQECLKNRFQKQSDVNGVKIEYAVGKTCHKNVDIKLDFQVQF